MVSFTSRPLGHRQVTPVPTKNGGSGSSVGIATDYGLEGPGSNPGADESFPSVRPPVKLVPGLSRG